MRVRKLLLRVAAGLVIVPVGVVGVALGVVLVGINIGPGQRLIERKLGPLTGGMVEISGLSGTLPQHLAVSKILVKDSKGPWLELDNADLRWSPLSLLHLNAKITSLSASRIAVLRKMVPSPDSAATQDSASTSPSSLHLRVDLASLHVGRVEITPDYAGAETVLSLDGHAHIRSIAPFLNGVTIRTLPVMDVALNVRRLDEPGHLTLAVQTPPQRIAVTVAFQEGAAGFISTLGKMPQLDPLDLKLKLTGPRKAAALGFALSAGPIKASANGTLDLLTRSAQLGIKANAPAMTLLPDVSWNGITLNADLRGPIVAPNGQGALDIDGLTASGAAIGHLHATFEGVEAAHEADTTAHLVATVDGLRVPGPHPTILASAPLTLDVMAHPLAPALPIIATLAHPLVQASVNAHIRPAVGAHLDVGLPDLQPLAALGKTDLAGTAGLHADLAMPLRPRDDLTLKSTGTLSITGGQAQALNLIGKTGTFSLDLAKSPQNVLTLNRFGLDGAALHVLLSSVINLADKNRMHTTASVTLPDLTKASPALLGNATLTATADGPTDDLALKADLAGDFGTKAVEKGPVALHADFQHLPSRPAGTLTAEGTLDHAPLTLRTALSQDQDGTYHLALDTLGWKSLTGKGLLRLPKGAKVPLGDLDVAIRDLGDFRRLAGQAIGGHLTLGLHTTEDGTAPPLVRIGVDGALSMDQMALRSLKIAGTVSNPADAPAPDLTLDLDGLRYQQMGGKLHGTVRGPQNAMAVALNGAFQNVMGAPANLDTALLLDLPDKSVRLDRLTALIKGESLKLGRPARIGFGTVMGVDRLVVTLAPPGVAPASIDVAGTIKPALALTAEIDNLTPSVARPFAPTLSAGGAISASARLGGTLAAPTGTVSIKGRDLRMLSGPAASLPAAQILANIALAGQTAHIDTTLNAGPSIALAVRGTAPLSKTGPLALTTNGHVDLSVANGVLGASGMGLAGQVGINLALAGTVAQPMATGRVTLENAAFDQYAQGVHLNHVNGALVASGDTITLSQIVAHAGPGTISVDGSVGAFRPDIPVDLHIVSQKARPVSSDILTATVDADLHIHGQATTRLDVDGKVKIPNATINIPDSMPASVPQLDVIRPGQKVVSSSGQGLVIGLGVDVISPGEFYVRGHGVFAEMQGQLHVRGTSADPSVAGGFDLKRGNFNLGGINLNFTKGRVAFNGSGVNHKLDPTLDFRADRNANGTVASLLVSGYASAPKIDFSSVPSFPRDEVLSILLFGTDSHSLSTTQLAELGAAVVQLAGGSSFDPLSRVRNLLGLDRLAIGGGSGVNGGGTSVEAGKYVMKGVYVGAKQATSGSGTQAQVQIDLTKRLKLNTTVGTGGQVTGFTTPENDPGSSIGLSYGYSY